MVMGLEIKYSVMLITLTMFFYLTAILNPIIELICDDPNCRDRMRSEFDTDFGNFSSYEDWRNEDVSLQSNGHATLLKFNHGYVTCDLNCEDCGWKEDVNETCANYNDTEYELLKKDLEELSDDDDDDFDYSLPSYLVPNCSCRAWCADCDDSDLVSLPGDSDGKKRHMQNYWNKLQKSCKEWQSQLGSDDDEMCILFQRFYFTMKLTGIGFAWLGVVLALMMFMEYTNFHIFYNGKCICCFRSACFKKILFTLLLTAPVSFMMVTGMELYFGDTEELLDKYFDLVGASFKYSWDTRGVTMFYISMGLAFLSIVVLVVSGKKQRHLRTIINYRRGVEYNGVDWKPHIS